MSKITIEVRLTDEDRKLLSDVTTAVKKGSKSKGEDDDAIGNASASDDVGDDIVDDDVGDDVGDNGAGDDAGDNFDDDNDDATEPTKADVQTALRDLATVTSKAAAIKLMKEKGGVDALTKLKASKFKAVIDAAKAATKKAKK